jgi:hypothetical protein
VLGSSERECGDCRADGVVLDYGVAYGAAPDGQPAVERALDTLGVRTVAIPRQARTSPGRASPATDPAHPQDEAFSGLSS